MKKLLSFLICAAIVLSSLHISAVSAQDNCILFRDTSGVTGYSAAADHVNAKVKSEGGATLIFDVYAESFVAPAAGQFSQLAVFTGGGGSVPYNFASYDFVSGTFKIGASDSWIINNQSGYKKLSESKTGLEMNRWYELAFQFDGRETVIYVDGIPVAAAEYDAVSTDYLILYPQYCTVKIDNIRVCGRDYNVRDRYGDLWISEDFSGLSSLGACASWTGFGAGYSLADGGRAVQKPSDMLPEREVSPAIDGAYLRYTETSGGGSSSPAFDLTPYGGFTVVEDIRVDSVSPGANVAVWFGGSYIAGYDFDSYTFMIAKRSYDGFDTSAVYGISGYSLSVGTVYELAFRQYGATVSVYLNGVLAVTATNPDFDGGYGDVKLNHYRMSAAVDNFVAAYPDYDVKEARGGAAGRFTFDEKSDFIENTWKFGVGRAGCSQVAAGDAPRLSIGTARAEGGLASVQVSVSGDLAGKSFSLDIAYPETFAVQSINTPSGMYASPTDVNPLRIVYAGGDFAGGEIAEIVFSTDGAEPGRGYDIYGTAEMYMDGIPYPTLSASGRVYTESELPEGIPANIRLRGGYLTWDPADGAVMYELYRRVDGDEKFIDYTESGSMEFDASYLCPDPGEYEFVIYAVDGLDYIGVSHPFKIIVDADGGVTFIPWNGADLPFGDLTGDGYLGLADLVSLCRIVAGYETAGLERGDLDGDGEVSDDDIAILRALLTSVR